MNKFKLFCFRFRSAIIPTFVCLILAAGCENSKPQGAVPGNTSNRGRGTKLVEMEESFDPQRVPQGTIVAPELGGASRDSSNPDSTDARESGPKFSYSVLHWNVESGGNEPATIAAQLVELIDSGKYIVVGLSEVHAPEVYEQALSERWPERFQFIRGLSGTNEDREDDHLWFAFDTGIFELVHSEEMKEIGGFLFDDGHHRVPLYVRLNDKSIGREMVFVMNHLARGDEEFRQAQARTLREWARSKTIPIIAIGDYNFDFVFETQKGNPAFEEMMRDNVWKWVRPDPLVDTNWSDRDGDGIDNYIDSILDFSLVAGEAKTWNATSHVIVRENDFPDNEKTSDHRPVELILKNN